MIGVLLIFYAVAWFLLGLLSMLGLLFLLARRGMLQVTVHERIAAPKDDQTKEPRG